MKASIQRMFVWAALVAAGFASAWLLLPNVQGHAQIEKPLAAGLVRSEDAVPTRGAWGDWRRYFRGETHGTRDMVVLVVTLKPGQAPHPPHQHAEEEFMILTEGTGTWHVDGKDIPARKGDVVYAAPWTMHGLKNTGDAPLTYFMVKWNNQGVNAPAKPAEHNQKLHKDIKPGLIFGAWKATSRIAGGGSLYQPTHGARRREAIVHFEQNGDSIKGYSETPNYKEIENQGKWNGKTEFSSVRYADNKLIFEFDIAGWMPKLEPLSDQLKQEGHKGTIRVEARLSGDKLVGKWGIFAKDGAELYRGEWDAVREKRLENQRLPDESRAIEVLSDFTNVKISRDKTQPGNPVIGVSFTYARRKQPGPPRLVTDAVLRELAALTRLQSLTLERTEVTDAGLRELAGLKELHSLDIRVTPVTDAGVKELAAFKKLRTLGLQGTKVSDAGLKELATTLKQLQALDLSRSLALTDAGLKELAALKQLRTLRLRHTELTDANVKELSALTQLQTLDLFDCRGVTAARLKTLASLKELRFLDIGATQPTADGRKELAALKQLRHLRLDANPLTTAGLKEVAALKQLQTLSLFACRSVTDADLKELASLTQLKELDLNGCALVTDAGLRELVALKHLESLTINGLFRVTPAATAELKKAIPQCKVSHVLSAP